jgi:cysteine-rich repeat protein
MKQYLALLCLSLLGACSEVVTRTQLTFTIEASPTVLAQLETLSVVVRSDARGDQVQEFAKSELSWPVQIVVLPAEGNDSSYEVTLIATALDAQRAKLATQSVNAKFTREKLRNVPVSLGSDAVDAGPEQDAGPRPDAGQPEPPPGGKDAGNEKPVPTKDAGGEPAPEPGPQDAGSGAINCATPGNGIKCDDGNPCNGSERCEPANGAANNSGCVPGMDVVTCGSDATCDRSTGKCSTCLVKPDGDNDGVSSVACMGLDCNDSDDTVAPGKSELCDGKDNDCDGTVDGAKANPSCASMAPTGGTASCLSGRCTPACTNPNFQIEQGACVAPPVTCPIVNPCAPGVCTGGMGTYSCTCPSGFRAGVGMTHCAPMGTPTRKIGFEGICDDTPTPGAFVAEYKPLSSTLYAACGVSSITSGLMMSAPRLIQPVTTKVDGITKDVALASPPSVAGAAVELAIAFLPGVNDLSFDVLDLDNPAGLSVVVRAGGSDLPASMPAPAVGSKKVAFSQKSVAPIERVTLTYTPLATVVDDAFYVDELSFRVAGCGDKVVDMTAGEACDDGNLVQCDGCDNACATSPASCTAP